MDPKVETLAAALQTIRDRADAALMHIAKSAGEPKSLGWKCTSCRHIKHFTRPVPVEVAAPCPNCHGADFEPC